MSADDVDGFTASFVDMVPDALAFVPTLDGAERGACAHRRPSPHCSPHPATDTCRAPTPVVHDVWGHCRGSEAWCLRDPKERAAVYAASTATGMC